MLTTSSWSSLPSRSSRIATSGKRDHVPFFVPFPYEVLQVSKKPRLLGSSVNRGNEAALLAVSKPPHKFAEYVLRVEPSELLED
jgi:hypothetical protein